MIYKFKDIDQTFKYSGIYKINYPDGTFYIGKSINLYSRVKSHQCRQTYMHYTNGEVIDIEKCSIEILDHHLNSNELIIREHYFITKYSKSHPNLIKNGLKCLPTKKTLTQCFYNLKVETIEDFALQHHN